MQHGHQVAAFLAVLAVAGSTHAAKSSQAADWILGTHFCRPAIFMKMSVPLVITFDGNSAITSERTASR